MTPKKLVNKYFDEYLDKSKEIIEVEKIVEVEVEVEVEKIVEVEVNSFMIFLQSHHFQTIEFAVADLIICMILYYLTGLIN